MVITIFILSIHWNLAKSQFDKSSISENVYKVKEESSLSFTTKSTASKSKVSNIGINTSPMGSPAFSNNDEVRIV